MTVVDDLRRVRDIARIPLSELSELTGVAVPNLSALLSGRKDPQVSSLERLARGLGVRLIPVRISGRTPVAQLGDQIADAIKAGDVSGAYRAWIQIADDLATDPFTRALLVAEQPRRIDDRWDAAIAGVVAWRLQTAGLPSPDWVRDRIGVPTDRWRPPAEFPDDALPDASEVPRELRERGIWVATAELESA